MMNTRKISVNDRWAFVSITNVDSVLGSSYQDYKVSFASVKDGVLIRCCGKARKDLKYFLVTPASWLPVDEIVGKPKFESSKVRLFIPKEGTALYPLIQAGKLYAAPVAGKEDYLDLLTVLKAFA
jgi:hypothetical protein